MLEISKGVIIKGSVTLKEEYVELGLQKNFRSETAERNVFSGNLLRADLSILNNSMVVQHFSLLYLNALEILKGLNYSFC